MSHFATEFASYGRASERSGANPLLPSRTRSSLYSGSSTRHRLDARIQAWYSTDTAGRAAASVLRVNDDEAVLRSPRPCFSQIHIHLLPAWNEAILSPFGVLLLTIALLPLARLVWLFGAFRPARPSPSEEPGAPFTFACLGSDDKASSSTSKPRGLAFAVSILLFPLALAWSDRLGKLDVVSALRYRRPFPDIDTNQTFCTLRPTDSTSLRLARTEP